MDGNVTFSVKDMVTPGLRKMIDPGNRKKVLRAGSVVLARAATLSFKDPGGRETAWAPLAESTVKNKSKNKDKVLVLSGLLKDSFSIGEVTDQRATVGTDRPYAVFHQTGTKNMPRRPIIPADESGNLTERARREIGAAMDAAIRKSLK
jgi:phage gpG-like protein